MINTIKNNLQIVMAGAVLLFALMGFALTPAVVGAQGADVQNNLCQGADKLSLSGSTNCRGVSEGSENSLNNIITQVINIFSLIVGVIAVIMIIIGGFRYITSGGDSNNVGGAKNTIIYAIVGLIIVALAQVIVRFVLGRTAGTA